MQSCSIGFFFHRVEFNWKVKNSFVCYTLLLLICIFFGLKVILFIYIVHVKIFNLNIF